MLDNHLFRNSWVYQELIQEGVEKGRQESLQAQRLTLFRNCAISLSSVDFVGTGNCGCHE